MSQTMFETPYAGQTVRLEVLVHQDGFGDVTSMYVDDVVLTPEPASLALLALGLLIRRR